MRVAKLFAMSMLVLALVLASAGAGQVQAQAGITGLTSGIQVYNQGSLTANISLTIYDGTGLVLGTILDTINGTSAKTYFPVTGGGLPATFTGSAVISSDQPVVAINNLQTLDLKYADATVSFSAGGSPFYMPLIMCGNNGFNTFIVVQNTGSADAHITINYTPKAGAGNSGSETATIKPATSMTFDQKEGSATANCSTLGNGLPKKFVGSAIIQSDQPVVATVMEANTTVFPVFSAYNGFTGGSGTVNLPLVMAANNGMSTGIQIQNVSAPLTPAATVTITYSANNVPGGATPSADSCLLGPGESCTLLQASGFDPKWTAKYVGSATLTSAQPVVAIVNQSLNPGPSIGPWASTYTGFNPGAVTSSATAPLIMSHNGGLNGGMSTAIQVQNVGSGACSVTVVYSTNTGGAFAPANETFTLDPGLSKTIIQNAAPPANGSVNTWSQKYVGGAEVTGTGAGCKVAAIVNEVLPVTSDYYFTYNAFNH